MLTVYSSHQEEACLQPEDDIEIEMSMCKVQKFLLV